MRTVILLGLMYVGDSLGSPVYIHDPTMKQFLGWIIAIAILMDVIDFLKDRK